MNTLNTFKKVVGLLIVLTAISSCNKLKEELLPSQSSDSFTSAFYVNLVAAGMSDSNAAFVSGYSANSTSSISSNAQSVNSSSSDTVTKAKEKASQAVAAVGDSTHFPNPSDKKDALQIISQAQLTTLAGLVDSSELSDSVNEVGNSLSADLDDTGLTGSDLEDAISRQGKGIAKGLLESSVDASIHDHVIAGFSKGAVAGLLNNPNLAASGADLISSLTNGIIGEVGSGSGASLTAGGKGQIIKELLNGIKTQIQDDANLSDSAKDGYVAGVLDSANSAIDNVGDSNIKDTVADGIYSSDVELHAITIYEAGTSSSGWTFDGSGNPIPPTHWDSTGTINIAAGTKPIVLLLLSYEGVNWHLTGATSRVSKVILHGYYDQTVDTVDPSKVEKFSYESNSSFAYGIAHNDWFLSFNEPWTQALIVKVRQKTGAKLTSYQTVYSQNSFTVGDGLNAPSSLFALSFVRPWLFNSYYSGIEGYSTAGAPFMVSQFYLTNPLSTSISVRVWVENLTTSTAIIPAFDHTYTIAAGSSYFSLSIPFNQTGQGGTFKVHVEAPDRVLNFQKTIDGIIH